MVTNDRITQALSIQNPAENADRIKETIDKAGNIGHILNLGYGVLVGTPEENVGFFFETVRQISLS